MLQFLNLEYIYYQIYRLLINFHLPLEILDRFIFWWKVVVLIVTPFAFLGIFVVSSWIYRLRQDQRAWLEQKHLAVQQTKKVAQSEIWEKIINALNGESEADWKLAIIEADNLLDELVRKLNYSGDNLGERLRNIEPADFPTLQDAWEAHKIRNRIAHESGLVLTQREARRAIELYRRVFADHHMI